ncbi:MAG: GDSL-type esterase/lipase family protein [Calditrichia bacterium]
MTKKATKIPTLSWPKKMLFTLVAIAIPVLLLLVLEGILRLAGVGGQQPLVIQESRFGEGNLIVNRKVAQRYFSLDESMVPEASEEIFEATRRPNSLRVLCIGGSTTAGFPYEINATFPFQLQHRLRESLLDNYVEVINLGISAINSYSVVDLLPEMLNLQPDVMVIYMGHNEFYGAYGAASTQFVSGSHRLNKLYLRLRKFHLVNIMRDVLSGFASPDSTAKQPESLMKAMAAENLVTPDSPLRQRAYQQFEDNLSTILREAKQAGIQVVLSNLVSNLADQPPFVSGSVREQSAVEQARMNSRLLEAQSHAAAGRFKQADELLTSIDSSSARRQYTKAIVQRQSGSPDSALKLYQQARDLDMLPFRAPTEINRRIAKLAREQDVALVDMKQVFRTASEDQLPGNALFMEHLHPNLFGYQLMAQTFFEVLQKIQVLTNDSLVGWSDSLLSDAEIQQIIKQAPRDRAGVTALDEEIGALRIFLLTHRWPFANLDVRPKDYYSDQPEFLRQLAWQHLQKKVNWDEAHYALGDSLARAGDTNGAVAEFTAVRKAFPNNYYPAMRIGDLLVVLERRALAFQWYKRALVPDDKNPFVLAKLGSALVSAGRFPEAVEHLTIALRSEAERKVLSVEQKTVANYLLAISFANLKDFEKAGRSLAACLSLNPSYQPALKLQSQIAQFRSAPK